MNYFYILYDSCCLAAGRHLMLEFVGLVNRSGVEVKA